MPSGVAWTETALDIAGTKLHLTRGGSGPPVLVLHHDIGTLDRLPFYDSLAQSSTCWCRIIPAGANPNGRTGCAPRDIAAMHSWLLADWA